MVMKCQAAADWVKENPEASSDAFEEKKKTLIKQWTALSQQADVLVSALGESKSDKKVINLLYVFLQVKRGGGKKTNHTKRVSSMKQRQRNYIREEEKPTMRKRSTCTGKLRVLLKSMA